MKEDKSRAAEVEMLEGGVAKEIGEVVNLAAIEPPVERGKAGREMVGEGA